MVITDDGYQLVSILLISRALSCQKCFMNKYFNLYVMTVGCIQTVTYINSKIKLKEGEKSPLS